MTDGYEEKERDFLYQFKKRIQSIEEEQRSQEHDEMSVRERADLFYEQNLVYSRRQILERLIITSPVGSLFPSTEEVRELADYLLQNGIGMEAYKCRECKGKGVVVIPRIVRTEHGLYGKEVPQICRTCGGSGRIKE